MADQFEEMPPHTWQAKGKPAIQLPVESITEECEYGLVPRRRPYKPGAKLDNTARDKRVWTLTVLYADSVVEDGMPPAGIYPQIPNDLIASFDVGETGTLTLGTRGSVRAQAKSYRRVENTDNRNSCALSLVFWEDTEDGIDAASFTPSARAAAALLAQQIGLEADASGVTGSALVDLKTALAQLEGLLSAPTDYAEEINARINAAFVAVSRIEDSFLGIGPGGEPCILQAAQNSRILRLLRYAQYLAVDSVEEVQDDKITFVRYEDTVSIFDVAARMQQDANKLISLNPELAATLFAIPPRQKIKVLAA